jgi:hypothetical protein
MFGKCPCVVSATKKYNTFEDNIKCYKNPDSSKICYKKAEYDITGKLIGFYEPTINNHGYIQLDFYVGGPILTLKRILD